MSQFTPVQLTPEQVNFDSAEFEAISGWPFDDPFVGRLLRSDIPQRVQYGKCWIWIYRDPSGLLAGFGTLDVCSDCGEFTQGRAHPYIPLLAVNPTVPSKGYGTSIVRHLIAEAALLARRDRCQDVVFLDVYTSSEKAIELYLKGGFRTVSPEPLPDAEENGKEFIIMAKSVAISLDFSNPENSQYIPLI